MWLSRRHLVIALMVGGLVALGSYIYLDAQHATEMVVIASQDIPAFTQIDDTMVELAALPKAAVQPGTLPDLALTEGRIAQQPVPKGRQIRQEELAVPEGPAQGIAWQLAPDQRAMAVPSRPERAAGGRLRPGQFVDVVYFRDSSIHGPAQARTLLQGLKVLDVRDGRGGSWSPESTETPSDAVLAVSQLEAEILTYAIATGEVFVVISPYQPDVKRGPGVEGDNLFDAVDAESEVFQHGR